MQTGLVLAMQMLKVGWTYSGSEHVQCRTVRF